MDALASDLFCPNEHGLFRWIFDELVHRGDKYYHIADFPSYVEVQKEVSEAYQKDEIWCRKSVLNVARIGKFSSDRTVLEYARDIWHIGPYEKPAKGFKLPLKSAGSQPEPSVVNGEAIPVAKLEQ
jgi:glycogen phosphorylase